MSRFLLGSQNFNMDTDNSDQDWFEFVYPTWEELFKCIVVSDIVNYNNGQIKIKDIRKIQEMIFKGNFSDLQILFSTNVVEGGELEEWLLENRDKLMRANIVNIFNSNIGMVMNRLKIFAIKNDGKELAHVYHTLYLLDKFYNNGFKLDTMMSDERDLLLEMRHNPKSEHMELVKDLLVKIESRKDDFKNPIDNTILDKLNDFIYGLCKKKLLEEEGVIEC